MNIRKKTTNLVVMAVLAALIVIMSLTPIGYLKVGLVEITFIMIPVAIGAILLGPTGGIILGLVFGLTSYIQGATGSTPLGAYLFNLNPFFAVIVCIGSRTLMGFLTGLIFKLTTKTSMPKIARCSIAGFLSAALNTVFFMTTLVLCYAGPLKESGFWKEGKNVFAFVAAFVGVNAIVEAVAATFITGAVGVALYKAKLTDR